MKSAYADEIAYGGYVGASIARPNVDIL